MNQWISGIAGLVVAVVPFLALSETTLTWTLVIAGVVITVSSFWGMFFEATDGHTQGVTHA